MSIVHDKYWIATFIGPCIGFLYIMDVGGFIKYGVQV